MPKHKDLAGNELHPSRITLSQPNRAPLFSGEIVFDGDDAWIANGLTQDDWRIAVAAPAKIFSWVLNPQGYQPPSNTTLQRLELYWLNIAPADADANATVFNFLKAWEIGTDLAAGCPISLTAFVERYGIGCYVLLLSGPDPYGNGLAPFDNSSLTLPDGTVEPALNIFNFETDFLAADSETHTRPYGFQVVSPLAQVEILIGNR